MGGAARITNLAKEYSKTSHTVYSCQYHVIFCPKYRRKVLEEPIAKRLKELIAAGQKRHEYRLLDCEVMIDHVHLLLDVNPEVGVNKVVQRIKGYTSHELRKEFPALVKRLPTLWTRSKFISSCGSVTLSVVKKYIEGQKGI